MCGRFVLKDSQEKIIESFEINNYKGILNPRYNISPNQNIPVILKINELNYLEIMTWGLVPFKSKSKNNLINARIETVKIKPSFKNAFNNRRCLVPANGFFEWKKVKSKKTPYFISLKNKDLFAFAGIWEYRKSNKGENIKTFAILTTSSNSFMKNIHYRMPVILTKNYFNFWLEDKEINLKELYETCSPSSMQAWEVTNKVGSSVFDNPTCIKKITKKNENESSMKFINRQVSFFD